MYLPVVPSSVGTWECIVTTGFFSIRPTAKFPQHALSEFYYVEYGRNGDAATVTLFPSAIATCLAVGDRSAGICAWRDEIFRDNISTPVRPRRVGFQDS